MNRIIFIFCKTFFSLIILTLTSCNNSSNNKPTETDTNIYFKQLIRDWNKSHSTKDVGMFSKLYDNTVLFYGSQKEKNVCIESKLTYFKKHPDFFQQIYGDIQIDNLSDQEVKCSFVKRITVNHSTSDYPSYLIFKKNDNEWKIVTESDLLTDENISKSKTAQNDVPKDAIKGDFNGDGVLDYMWLVAPKIDNDGMDCVGDCTSYIKFSDSNIPYIKISNCIGGIPVNEGDLNKNGTDEIGLLPGWFTSCWRSYNVWTILNGKWEYAVEPFSTHCNQWDEGVKPIEIDLNRDGYVIIRYSELTDVDIITKSKSVRVLK